MSLIVSVQIPTWRRKDMLRQLIVDLESQSVPTSQYEIRVCDSGSGDGTQEMMQEMSHCYDNLRYMDIKVNTLSSKRNAMFNASSAPIIILLDDDLRVCSDFIAAHLRALEGRKRVLCCGQIRFPEEWVKRSNYYRFRDSRHIGPDRPDIDPRKIPPRFLTVMNLSMHREEVEPLGFMSEQFRKYGGEDHEFAHRMARAGFTFEYAEDAICHHYEGTGRADAISGYERKMYSLARYGVPLLAKMAPDVIASSVISLLERRSPNDSYKIMLTKVLLGVLINPLCSYFVRKYLLVTDRWRVLYCSAVFRYLFASAMLTGVRERCERDLQGETQASWI